jgi:hypothetical protein
VNLHRICLTAEARTLFERAVAWRRDQALLDPVIDERYRAFLAEADEVLGIAPSSLSK